jgi:hypothetical protein
MLMEQNTPSLHARRFTFSRYTLMAIPRLLTILLLKERSNGAQNNERALKTLARAFFSEEKRNRSVQERLSEKPLISLPRTFVGF